MEAASAGAVAAGDEVAAVAATFGAVGVWANETAATVDSRAATSRVLVVVM